ncbi:hypothetical protein K470DRAFT_216648 [Piedraia hortae CBS 480.64]|uniref:Velvet domain-containing protein n=1 Tax=Piedraia hortae CBS 480.64 TaxID=1314780 RepID=A0A6A7C210_9PEZI|nr:hypothetical protein K470DRAFT_216648 [Piedraia hortae CBS 480.64]
MAILIDENLQGNKKLESDQLLGQTTSSLHKLKDVNNCDGGFFVFGDLSVRKVGRYRLRFHLFDANRPLGMAQLLAWVDSQPFNVLARKDFEGLRESTHLSRAFADQGVKLKISKGSRSQYVSIPQHRTNLMKFQEAQRHGTAATSGTRFMYETAAIQRQHAMELRVCRAGLWQHSPLSNSRTATTRTSTTDIYPPSRNPMEQQCKSLPKLFRLIKLEDCIA